MRYILCCLLAVMLVAEYTVAQVGKAGKYSLMLGNCDKVNEAAMERLPATYKAGKHDSVKAITATWQQACGVTEPIFSLQLLIAIEEGEFRKVAMSYCLDEHSMDEMTDSAIIRSIYHYLQAYRAAESRLKQLHNSKDRHDKVFEQYYGLLQNIASGILSKPGLTPAEHFIVQWYAGGKPASDERELTTKAGADGWHKRYMQEPVGGSRLFLNGGYMAPMQQLSAIGGHPMIGGGAGHKFNKWSVNLAGTAYLREKTGAIPMNFNDSTYYFGSNAGGSIAIETGYDLWRNGTRELDILGNVGYTGINLKNGRYTGGGMPVETQRTPALKYWDAGIGAGYTFYGRNLFTNEFMRHGYLSIEARYHFLLPLEDTRLTGGFFTARCVIGITDYTRLDGSSYEF